jgi:tripartite ATP-independent transporter DctP family solute receptor
MRLSRQHLIAGGSAAFASIAILRRPAGAAQFSYKLANDQAATHPMNLQSIEAAKRILAASNGALEIKVYPNSTLGGDPQMLAQARQGSLEFLQIGNNVLGNVMPASALLNIPFAFSSAKEFMQAVNGPLGAYVGSLADGIGLHKLDGGFYGGTFQMENSLRAIESPADLKGLKIRVPPGPIDVATFKAFDASPTVISLGEVYTSLMTHLVDGVEVPLPTMQNFKFYEQIKFCSITNHSGLGYFMTANPDAWKRLPRPLQEIVEREFAAAGAAASDAFAAQETTIEGTLKSEGVKFSRPALEPFRDVIRKSGLYAKFRDQFDPKGWDALEKTTGKLA